MLNICLPSDEYVCQVVEGKGEVQCQQSCQGEQTKRKWVKYNVSKVVSDSKLNKVGEVQCQTTCQRQQTTWLNIKCSGTAHPDLTDCTTTSLPYLTDWTVPPDPTWRYFLTLPKKLYWTVTLDRTWQTVLYILTLHGRLYLLTLPPTLYCTCHLLAVQFLYMSDRCVPIDLTVSDTANFTS